MLKIHQLRYLVALADTLSFSKAAALCHVTQPTLSAQIKELEVQLQTQLVERSRSYVFLTPIGAEVAKRARTVLAQTEDIIAVARGARSEKLAGTLQMGVVQTVGAYVLSLAMPLIRERYPDLKLSVWEDRIENLPAKLHQGTHDLMLIPERPDDANIMSTLLIHEPFLVVMPYDHRLASLKAIAAADLRGETILSMERARTVHEQISQLCAKAGASYVTDYAGTTLDTLRQMVAARMGIAMLPALYVRSDVLREKLVVARPLSFSGPQREIHMAWRSTSPDCDRFSELAAMITECLEPWNCANHRQTFQKVVPTDF